MNSMKLAAIFALAISAGIAGCAAQTDDTDETTGGQDQAAAVADGRTGQASEKCGFGCFGGGLPFFSGAIGFGSCGAIGPCAPWAGPAFPPCGGGWPIPGIGGLGCCW